MKMGDEIGDGVQILRQPATRWISRGLTLENGGHGRQKISGTWVLYSASQAAPKRRFQQTKIKGAPSFWPAVLNNDHGDSARDNVALCHRRRQGALQ